MTRPGLSGVVPVLETPFTADGDVDRDSFARMTEHVVSAGVSGVMFPGYASEVLKLDDGERRDLTATLLAGTSGRPEVGAVISVPEHATRTAVRTAVAAAEAGADAINVLPPYLLGPSAREVLDHLDQVLAAVAPLPVIAQFAPVQTGTTLGAADLIELAGRHPNLTAVKVEANPPGRVVTALAEKGVASLVGYAGLHLPDALRRGAAGLQPGCSFVEIYVELWRQWGDGDTAGFAALHSRLLPYLSSWMQHVEHIVQVEKTISVTRGLIAGDTCRRPGYRLDEYEAATIPRFLEEFAALLGPAEGRAG